MRRTPPFLTTLVAAALLLAGSAPLPSHGQDAPADEAADAEAAQERPAPPEELQATAVLFFHALREGLPGSAAAFCDTPFVLDGETIKWRRPLEEAFDRRLSRTDLSVRAFNGVRLLTPEEMQSRHGPPPERLGELDLEGAGIAVANFGGHGHAAVFRNVGGRWLAAIYTD